MPTKKRRLHPTGHAVARIAHKVTRSEKRHTAFVRGVEVTIQYILVLLEAAFIATAGTVFWYVLWSHHIHYSNGEDLPMQGPGTTTQAGLYVVSVGIILIAVWTRASNMREAWEDGSRRKFRKNQKRRPPGLFHLMCLAFALPVIIMALTFNYVDVWSGIGTVWPDLFGMSLTWSIGRSSKRTDAILLYDLPLSWRKRVKTPRKRRRHPHLHAVPPAPTPEKEADAA